MDTGTVENMLLQRTQFRRERTVGKCEEILNPASGRQMEQTSVCVSPLHGLYSFNIFLRSGGNNNRMGSVDAAALFCVCDLFGRV